MTPPRQSAPDYTNAFLVMAWLCLVVGLTVLWGVAGYVAALVASLGLNAWIGRYDGRNGRRDRV